MVYILMKLKGKTDCEIRGKSHSRKNARRLFGPEVLVKGKATEA